MNMSRMDREASPHRSGEQLQPHVLSEHLGDTTERVHSHHRHIVVACVGAGAAGLMTAYQAKKFLQNYSLTLYEKYPGVGCDVPSHAYTFSFEAMADWDGFYPHGYQVHKYFVDFADKYDLRKHVRFGTTVIRAKWIDHLGQWELHLQRPGGVCETEYCHVLVNGSGPLNKWKWPSIEGLHTFKGTLVHTAQWDPDIDWKGKRVGVIGNGSSGIQVIPQLAKGAEHLIVFAKSPQWIVPPIGLQDIRVIPDSKDSAKPAPAGKHYYSTKEKDIFQRDPHALLRYRKAVDTFLVERFPIFLRNHPARKIANDMAKDVVEQRLRTHEGDEGNEGNEEDWKGLYRPPFSVGCKRPTPGDDFLETLAQSHVASVTSPVVGVGAHGVQTGDGGFHEIDVLVCATGFDVAFAPHFDVRGLHGKNIKDEWRDSPQCYLSVASPNFPNLFFIGGPTGNWAGPGSVLVSHEVQAQYAMQCAAKISSEQLHSVVPKEEVTRRWVEHVNKWHTEQSVWAEECSSWMKYNGRIQLWPGSLLNLLKTIRSPRWEDYEIVRRESDMWSFLGDGRTKREVLREQGLDIDLSPYMRMDDTYWTVDI